MIYKQQLYQQIYNELGLIIVTYEKLIEDLIRQSIKESYNGILDTYGLRFLEIQVYNYKKIVNYLRDTQYWAGVVVLSDGGLITDTELGNALEIVEILLEEMNTELKDKVTADWATDKIMILDRIKDVFLQFLEYKVKIKNKRGDLTLQ